MVFVGGKLSAAETVLRIREKLCLVDAASLFLVTLPPTPSSSSLSPCFLIYSLDCHMAAIPALDSACHHALTLIGLICYSFPFGLGRILGTWSLDVSRQDF